MERLVMQSASSSYPLLGAAYSCPGYAIEYSIGLSRAWKNYYDSKPKDGRMSTAAEELAIQLNLERAGQDPRIAAAFDDLFAKNDSKIYMFQWTATGLRVPKGRDPIKYERDRLGEKYWIRELLIEDQVAGEISVPEGNGRFVVEWDGVSGLPSATRDNHPRIPYVTQFWFDPNSMIDEKSGQKDVAVVRACGWSRSGGGMNLAVVADYSRSSVGEKDGFRLVMGSMPKIKRIGIEINPTNQYTSLADDDDLAPVV